MLHCSKGHTNDSTCHHICHACVIIMQNAKWEHHLLPQSTDQQQREYSLHLWLQGMSEDGLLTALLAAIPAAAPSLQVSQSQKNYMHHRSD